MAMMMFASAWVFLSALKEASTFFLKSFSVPCKGAIAADRVKEIEPLFVSKWVGFHFFADPLGQQPGTLGFFVFQHDDKAPFLRRNQEIGGVRKRVMRSDRGGRICSEMRYPIRFWMSLRWSILRMSAVMGTPSFFASAINLRD